MIKTIKSALMQITSWKTDPRVIMAFLFGFALLCVEGYPYLKFAAFVRSDVQSVEMFVLCGSDGFAFMALFLGNLLLLSNAPFLSETTTYEMLRMGKKRWIDSKIIYIGISLCNFCSCIPHSKTNFDYDWICVSKNIYKIQFFVFEGNTPGWRKLIVCFFLCSCHSSYS